MFDFLNDAIIIKFILKSKKNVKYIPKIPIFEYDCIYPVVEFNALTINSLFDEIGTVNILFSRKSGNNDLKKPVPFRIHILFDIL